MINHTMIHLFLYYGLVLFTLHVRTAFTMLYEIVLVYLDTIWK
jgi:hypothetical protein